MKPPEDEVLGSPVEEETYQEPKRVKRHRFKTAKERIREIDIDVYKSLVPRRTDPLPGSSSFFHERLSFWREMNAAHEWLDVYVTIQPLCTTLPQLVHHHEQVLENLLKYMHMEYALSLEPLLDLTATLSRDLSSDFLPLLNRVLRVVCGLVQEGGDTNADVLGYIFTCLSTIFKNLAKFLVMDLRPLFKMLEELRHHRAEHVQKFMAESLGFLIRRAPDDQARGIVEYMYEECNIASPHTIVCRGNGEILASSVKGVNHCLHSRCGRVLGFIFDDSLIFDENDREKEHLSAEIQQLVALVFYTRETCVWSCLEYVRGKEAAEPIRYIVSEKIEMYTSRSLKSDGERVFLMISCYSILFNTMLRHRGGSRVDRNIKAYSDLMVSLLHSSAGRKNTGTIASNVGNSVPSDRKLAPEIEKYQTPDLEQCTLMLMRSVMGLQWRKDPALCESLTRMEHKQWANQLGALKSKSILMLEFELLESFRDGGIPAIFLTETLLAAQHEIEKGSKDFAWAILVELCNYLWERQNSCNQQISGEDLNILKSVVDQGFNEHDEGLHMIWAAQTCAKTVFAGKCKEGIEYLEMNRKKLGQRKKDGEASALLAAMVMSQVELFRRHLQIESLSPGIIIPAAHEMYQRFLDIKPGYRVIECIALISGTVLPMSDACSPKQQQCILESLSPLLKSPNQSIRIKALETVVNVLKFGNLNLPDLEENVMSVLHDLEVHPVGADSGRHAVVSLGRVENLLEYKRIPQDLTREVVNSLLGLLHVKLSSYWGPVSKALGAAVNSFPADAWPIFCNELRSTQSELYREGIKGSEDAGVEIQKKNSSLHHRYVQFLQAGEREPHSDPVARFSHLLKTMTHIQSNILRKYHREWVPLFLSYVGDSNSAFKTTNDDGSEDDMGNLDTARASPRRYIPPKLWRQILRDWLQVFHTMQNPKQMEANLSKEVLMAVSGQLLDTDPNVQKSALNVLKMYRIQWMTPYIESLMRFADNKTLRAELTSFPLARRSTSVRQDDSVQEILEEHRHDLIPILIAVLFPKMRKRNGRLGGKGAPGSARVAILNFLTGAESEELSPLLELFLLPMSSCFRSGTGDQSLKPEKRFYLEGTTKTPWWGAYLGKNRGDFWLQVIDEEELIKQPVKRRVGYLNAIDDLLKHLGFKVGPYLPEILALILRIFRISTLVCAKEEGAKEVRTSCLRLLSTILKNYPNQMDYGFVWPDLFSSMHPFIENIPKEANSEKPPALLNLCRAITEHEVFLPVVSKAPGSDLLRMCLETLSSTTCADPSRSEIMDLIENLFDGGALLGSVEVDLILSGLQCTLEGNMNKPKIKRLASGQPTVFSSSRKTATRALQILERMANEAEDMTVAMQLVRTLVPLFSVPKRKVLDRSRRLDEEMIARSLEAMSALMNKMGDIGGFEERSLDMNNILDKLCPLVVLLTKKDARLALCEVFLAAGRLYSDLAQGANMLRKLNSMSEITLDEPDYDARLTMYAALDEHAWRSLPYRMAAVLVLQCCLDSRSESDISLRNASSGALSRMILMISERRSADDINLAKRFLMPEIRLFLNSPVLAVRQELLEIVRKVSLGLPVEFSELNPLTKDDEEIDFWLNVAHLQLHRRVRAFSRVMRIVQSETLSSSLVTGYLFPLIEQAVLDCNSAGKEVSGHEAKQVDIDRGANVTDAAINLLVALSKGFDSTQFQKLVSRYLALMVAHADAKCMKSLIRTVCLLLESVESSVDSFSDEFISFLTSNAIPNLKEKLVEGETVRAIVAMALVKVLKLLPAEFTRNELPKILQTVCNLLKSRLQRIRDDARSVLGEMARELGPLYLAYVIQVLKTSLPSRGYMAHVIGYTLHDVLQAVVSSLKYQEPRSVSSALDACLPIMVPMIEDDLFTDIAEAKEAKEFSSNYKESKRCKANASFEILASIIDIEHSLPVLLQVVWTRLEEAQNPKTRAKLTLLLQHASRGLVRNPSANSKSIGEMVFGILEPIMKFEDELRLSEKDMDFQQGHRPMYDYLMAEFAVSTLLSCLKKRIIDLEDGDVKYLLPVVVQALSSRSSGVVSTSLQCISMMIHSINATEIALDQKVNIGKKIVQLLRRCPSPMHSIAQESFRLLATFLRCDEDFMPRDSELRFLVTWSFNELDSSSEKQGAFTLLRAILQRKLVVPEVYDVMSNVQELMIRSQSSQVRQLSSAALLQFILDYPLGNKRLEHHLQFLLANLDYQHETGRISSLDMLHTLVKKFPEKVLCTWADKIFIPVVVRMVNEQVPSIRERVADCLTDIMDRVNSPVRSRLLSFVATWLAIDQDPKLQRASIMVLASLMNGLGTKSRYDAELQACMAEVVGVPGGQGPGPLLQMIQSYTITASENDSGSAEDWKTLYQALVLLEKVLVHDTNAAQGCMCLPDLWKAVASGSCLLHDHVWIRKASARFIGTGLATNHEKILQWCSGEVMASTFVQQLDADEVDDDLAAQAVKCIVFLSMYLSTEEMAGVVRSMVKMADNTSFTRSVQRNYALRFIAAVVSRLGPDASKPHLPMLLRPIHRILEPGGPTPDDAIRTLAEEVFAHVKSVVSTDVIISSYNTAREEVQNIRKERKVKAAVQAQVDPEAAARRKLRATKRKALGKKKALEEVRRLRSVGVAGVKNKKTKR